MKPLIVANWKCNPTSFKKAKRLFNLVEEGALKHSHILKNVRIIICPPFVYLPVLKSLSSVIKLGAQDIFWEEEGAYTGEVSAPMLKSISCEYVIVGHSERRIYFGETNETINKKIKAVFEAGLNPILCVGETWEERNQGKTENILEEQIKSALENISKFKIQNSRFSIAYEPIWAIGKGKKPCKVEEARKINLLIRDIISDFYNLKSLKKIRILYGGSVNSKNAADYITKAGLNGLLIGRASLNAREFIKIVNLIYDNFS